LAPQLLPEQDRLLKEVSEAFEQSDRLHRQFRTTWERLYRLYRSNKSWRSQYRESSDNDRDVLMSDAKKEWGADLVIPYCYSVVETIMPQMVLHRPRMLVLPREDKAVKNIENMRLLIDVQQERIGAELRFQSIGKDGLIFGMGVAKTQWEHRTRVCKKLEPRLLLPGHQEVEREEVLADDPTFERVYIGDFFWDPFGDSVANLDYAIHRTWRNEKYIRQMVESGTWTIPDGWELEDLTSAGPINSYDSLQRSLMEASGFTDYKARGSQPHEVWEFHDGKRVVTVLDRQAPVQLGANPAWHGQLPFQVYRPVDAANGHLPGIGVIEPIEDLSEEMNVLRTQRRDNATLKLQQTFAFNEGAINREDMVFGPGMAIPVNGEPRESLMQINVGDIPNSSYQEELALQANIERTTGLSDEVSGGGGSGDTTATEAQIKLAAANRRIQLMTLRFEQEVIASVAGQWLELNQQRIRKAKSIPVPVEPAPGQPEQRWSWRKVGPDELAGKMSIRPDGGSTAPENVPQMRQDAMQIVQLFGQNPQIDQRRLLEEALEKFSIKNPSAWLLPDEPRVPPKTLDLIMQLAQQSGLPPEALQQLQQIIMQAGQMALQEEQAQNQEPQQEPQQEEQPA